MRLTELKLYFFKNHEDKNLVTANKIIGLWGKNGMGKSNILDAIYFLTIGKSYFSSADLACIHHNSEISGLKGTFSEHQISEIKIKLQKGKRKVISKNDKPYAKIAEHLGNFLSVIIAPGDIQIIYGGNEVRRNFTDQIICQYDGSYLNELLQYNKLLLHRNAVLKQDQPDWQVIQSLDHQIAPKALHLFQKRLAFFEDFAPILSQEYRNLSGNTETIELKYLSQLNTNSYASLVKENKSKDLILKRSNIGIHKDEIELLLDHHPLKNFGSQGQIKSALIALKIAAFQILKQKCDKTPILLLDDIFEKIDEERANQLTKIIKSENFDQIFITDTHKERLEYFCSAITEDFQLIQLAE